MSLPLCSSGGEESAVAGALARCPGGSSAASGHIEKMRKVEMCEVERWFWPAL